MGRPDSFIDYDAIRSDGPTSGLSEITAYLAYELPYEWSDSYGRLSPHKTNVLRIKIDSFEYLFDFSTELVNKGEVSAQEAVEDRLVAVHGESHPARKKRDDAPMRQYPLGPVEFLAPLRRKRYDKGHFIGHASGGGLYINLFPQPTAVNRGWSETGKLFRSMESYCQKNPGTYCFSRPIYGGRSGHPHVIEFGILRSDESLWVNSFPNFADPEEMAEIERRFEERIMGG